MLVRSATCCLTLLRALRSMMTSHFCTFLNNNSSKVGSAFANFVIFVMPSLLRTHMTINPSLATQSSEHVYHYFIYYMHLFANVNLCKGEKKPCRKPRPVASDGTQTLPRKKLFILLDTFFQREHQIKMKIKTVIAW